MSQVFNISRGTIYHYLTLEKLTEKSGIEMNIMTYSRALKKLTITQKKTYFIFNGYCDARIFEIYLEKCLLPELLPKKIIILDNAAFHKPLKARELIAIGILSFLLI